MPLARGARRRSETARPRLDGSALACLGVSGYLVGLALPQSAVLDVPLVFLVACAVLAALASPQQVRLAGSLITWPLLAFVAARLASALAAPDPLRSLRIVAPFLPALLLFLVLSEWVRTEHHLVVIYLSLTAAGLMLATGDLAIRWLSAADRADSSNITGASPVLLVNNDLVLVAVLAPFALAAALLRPRPLVRLLVAAFFAALVATVVVTRSRTILLTAIVATGALARLTAGGALISHRRRVYLLASSAVAGIILLDALLGFRLAHKVLSDWQGSGRLPLWAVALRMFQEAPLLGHGPHSFFLQYQAHLDALHLPAWMAVDSRQIPWPHNLFLELLAEQGALGLLTFLALAATGIAMVARLLRAAPRDTRPLAAGAGAALIAFLVASVVELTLLRVWVIIMLGALLGLLAAIARLQHKARAR